MTKKFYSNANQKQAYIRKCLKEKYKGKGSIPKSMYRKFIFLAPSNFSLIENPQETISYFNEIIDFVLSFQDFAKIRFDLSNVSKMTIDAVMYMIAIAKNIECNDYQKTFNILVPKDTEVSNFILSTGIENYFDASLVEIGENSDFYSIQMGSRTDVNVAKGICDFTNENLNKNIKFTGFLYDMLIEMMTNTGQHAYTIKDKIKNQWFIFAENAENSIRYTFIDTGLGIPKTMSKYMIQVTKEEIEKDGYLEKILDGFTKEDSADANLILTGLTKGGLRTRTDKPYRGKGLPEIYDHFRLYKKTSNLKIISGACLCEFDNDNRNNAVITNLNEKFVGTLFYWEIDKNGGACNDI